MSRLFTVVSCLLIVPTCAVTQENVSSIIQHSVEATKRDWAAAPKFNDLDREKTKNGSKTYDELMIDGSPYEHLVAINDHSLSGARQKEEEKKLKKTIAERQKESPEEKARRIARYQAERKRDHQMMEEMTKAFTFALVGAQTLDGHQVYMLKATPRPGYQPPTMETRALKGMQGTLWIDKSTYQWVKVEAQVIHPVSIMGFAARVEPGTRFELEKMPVSDDIWLPKHFAMKSQAKIMLLFQNKQQEEDTFSDYRPAQSSTTQASANIQP